MTRLKTAARKTNINLETCQITAVGSVKHFTCHRFSFMEEELHKKVDFFDAQLLTTHTLSAKGPTPNCDLSICFGRASFVDRSKNGRKENVIMKLFVWLLLTKSFRNGKKSRFDCVMAYFASEFAENIS